MLATNRIEGGRREKGERDKEHQPTKKVTVPPVTYLLFYILVQAVYMDGWTR